MLPCPDRIIGRKVPGENRRGSFATPAAGLRGQDARCGGNAGAANPAFIIVRRVVFIDPSSPCSLGAATPSRGAVCHLSIDGQ